MAEERDDSTEEAPSFVPDDVASAGTEKPAVAPDNPGEDASRGVNDPQQRVPEGFEVDDAITKTALEDAGEDEQPA